jgi:uncharacterized protein YaaW (UPF0174 family)
MAKRMVLVEEQVYNNNGVLNYMKAKDQNDVWKQSPVETSKTHLNTSLQSQLASVDLPDDVKAKLYQKTLKRFLSLKQHVPELQPAALNEFIAPSVKKRKQKWSDLEPPMKKQKGSNSEAPVKKRKSPPVVKRAHWSAFPTRYSKRQHIPWSKFGNE